MVLSIWNNLSQKQDAYNLNMLNFVVINKTEKDHDDLTEVKFNHYRFK